MPERVQLKRTKGWRMPPNTVKVDRSTKWGNQFAPGQAFDAIVDKVLAYRPKPKTKPAKKRQRAGKRIQKERL